MPTGDELIELFTLCNKSFGTDGINFKGPNGKSIKLPFAGGKEYSLFGTGDQAYYRSASMYIEPGYPEEDDVICLTCEVDECVIDVDQSRRYGFSVRPVKDKPKEEQ